MGKIALLVLGGALLGAARSGSVSREEVVPAMKVAPIAVQPGAQPLEPEDVASPRLAEPPGSRP